MTTYVHLWYLTEIFLDWEIFQKKVPGRWKTCFVFNFFPPENRAVYEIMWKKMWYRQTGHGWQRKTA